MDVCICLSQLYSQPALVRRKPGTPAAATARPTAHCPGGNVLGMYKWPYLFVIIGCVSAFFHLNTLLFALHALSQLFSVCLLYFCNLFVIRYLFICTFLLGPCTPSNDMLKYAVPEDGRVNTPNACSLCQARCLEITDQLPPPQLRLPPPRLPRQSLCLPCPLLSSSAQLRHLLPSVLSPPPCPPVVHSLSDNTNIARGSGGSVSTEVGAVQLSEKDIITQGDLCSPHKSSLVLGQHNLLLGLLLLGCLFLHILGTSSSSLLSSCFLVCLRTVCCSITNQSGTLLPLAPDAFQIL